MSWLMRLVPLLVFITFSGVCMAGPQEDQRARNAVRVLDEVQTVPDQAIPDHLLSQARAIAVFPDSIKAGLLIGGRHGQGLITIKQANGRWSLPAFIKLTGASFGFQAGVQASDIVLVFRNDRSLRNIVNGALTLGADAGVAAGPVGRNASAATDGQLKAEIWSWSRSRGLFAGVALDGAVLQMDDKANQEAYGSGTTTRMVFEGRTGEPASADIFSFQDRIEEITYALNNHGAHRQVPVQQVKDRSSAGPTTVTAPIVITPEVTTDGTQQPAATSQTKSSQQGFEPVHN